MVLLQCALCFAAHRLLRTGQFLVKYSSVNPIFLCLNDQLSSPNGFTVVRVDSGLSCPQLGPDYKPAAQWLVLLFPIPLHQ
ncbi:hypothetical protein BJ741DRAFT_602168 [Chytriomyces cf. hyalinus JEL632]|nr:hypothetical protein BJ741DRAFT_602168 [Chytriomyces cf. hyalinus JEL632]